MRKGSLRRKPYETQLNNVGKDAGFSLVELLIAVIILAIIVIPLSRSFVVSARMNGNARRLQRATTVAQDIVEGLKAYNIDEIKEQFNNPTDGFYITDSRRIHGHITEDTVREQNDPNYSGNPDMPGVYYFAMENFEIQGVEYDALIKVDASVYEAGHTNAPGAAHNPNLHDNAFNTGGMSKPGSVMKNRDGSFTQNTLFTRAVLDEIQDQFSLIGPAAPPDPSDSTEDFTFKMFKTKGGTVKRTITLNIEKDRDETDAEGNTVTYCKADITFDYECTYGGDTKHIYGSATSPVGEIKNTGCAVDMTSGNFYLFYYPLYEATVDKIIINNTSGKPYQVFIVKQVDSSTSLQLSSTQLDSAERNYHAVVNVKDSTNNIDNLVIRTNLGMNLANDVLSGSGVTRAPGQMPTYEIEKPDVTSQVKYQFNKLDTDDISDDTNVNVFGLAGTRFRGSGGSVDDIVEVIFDIEVSIYRPGAYANNFADDTERMVVIEGSKNN